MKKPITITFLLMLFFGYAFSQQPTIQISQYNEEPGIIEIPVVASNLNNVGALQIHFSYDPAVLGFIDYEISPLFPGMLVNAFEENGIQQVAISWFSLSQGVNFAGDLVTLQFDYLGGSSDLSFLLNKCEISEIDGLNLIPVDVNYIDGSISGVSANTTVLLSNYNVELGNVEIPVEVTNFSNVGSLQIHFSYDPGVLSFIEYEINSAFPGMLVNAFEEDGIQQVAISWFSMAGGVDFTGDLVTLQFDYLGGSSDLSFLLNKSEINEIVGDNLNPVDVNFINGSISSVPTVSVIVDNVCATSGTINVPVTVQGFQEISAFEFKINYPSIILENTEIVNVNDFLSDANNGSLIYNIANDHVFISWFSLNIPLDVIDGEALFELQFDYTGQGGGEIVFVEAECEVTDENFISQPVNYVNGGVFPKPEAPTAHDLTVCFDGNEHSASATPADGSSLVWYTTAEGFETTTAPIATSAGTYTAWAASVDDVYGCESERTEVTLVINEEPAIGFDFNGQLADTDDEFIYCFNEIVSITLSKVWSGVAPFDITYELNGEPTTLDGVELHDVLFTGLLPVGEHTVVVTSIVDANGCAAITPELFYTASIVINNEPAVGFDFNGVLADTGDEFVYCYNETVSVTLSRVWSGTAPFDITYELNGQAATISGVELDDVLFTGLLPAGEHTVVITSIVDANECAVDMPEMFYHATIVINAEPQALFAINGDPIGEGHTEEVFYGDLVEVSFHQALAGDYPFIISWTVNDDVDHPFSHSNVEITEDEQLLFSTADNPLVAGQYDIQITSISDSNGCAVSDLSMYQATIIVAPKTLEVIADEGLNKVYGEDDPLITYTVTGFAYDDDHNVLTGELSREEGENVGLYAITIGTLAVSDDNYVINFTSADFEILPKELFIVGGFTAMDKVYDGNVIAEIDINNLSLNGLIDNDEVTIADIELEFEDPNVGQDKLVSIVNAVIDGPDVGNYIVNFPADKTLTGDANAINPADFGDDNVIFIHDINAIAGELVTVEIEIANSEDFVGFNLDIPLPNGFAVVEGTHQLHRNTNHDLMFNVVEEDGLNVVKLIAFSITNDAFIGNDGVIVTFEMMTAPGAGNFTLEIVGAVLGNANAENILDYTVDGAIVLEPLVGLPTALASIFVKDLTIGGNFTAFDKAYDGTIDAEIDEDNLELVGLVSGDDVSLVNLVVEFADANVGNDILVSIISANIEGTGIDNYSFNIDGAPDTVANIFPALLTVTVDEGLNKLYGEDDPVFTYTVDGFIPGEDDSLITGALSREPGEDVGFYAITVGTLSAGDNYVINLAPADFEITPATLAVAADEGLSKIYGEDDPVFTYTATGFQFDDDATIFTGALERELGEDIGIYAILIGSLSAGDNYLIDFTSANFEINAATLAVVANDDSKVYGDDDPVFTFTASGFQFNDDDSIITGALDREPGEDAGNYSILIGSLSAGDNYLIDFTSADFMITMKQLFITGTFTAFDKEYDSTTAAEIDDFNLTLIGVIGDDDVELTNVVVEFEDPNVDENIPVNIINAEITGDHANNYYLVTGLRKGTDVRTDENVMLVHDINAEPGDIVTVEIEVLNYEEFVGFSVDLPLPDGFTYVEGSAQLHRGTNHDVVFNVIEATNLAKMIAFSITNDAFLGNDGVILTFDLQTPDVTGEWTLELVDAVLGNVEAQDILDYTVAGTVTISQDLEFENIMIINDVFAMPGSIVTIEIEVENEEDFAGFSVDVPLPEGFEYIEGSAELFRGTNHGFVFNVIEGNIAKIIAFSITNDSFIGNEGLLFSFDLQTPDIIGDFTIPLVNAVLGNAEAQDILTGTVNGTIILDDFIELPSAFASIYPKELTIGGSFTVFDKVFDGTPDAEIDDDNLQLIGVIGDEDVDLANVVVEFAHPDVGNDILVSIIDAELVGAGISNYELTIDGAPTTIADILATLTLIAEPEEGGTVTGAGIYNFGEMVDVDAIPNSGWGFVNWTDLDGNFVSDQAFNTIEITSNLTLIANFEEVDEYTLTLIANPEEGGSVTGAGVYNFGDMVDVDAIPNEGWEFVDWTDLDGNLVSDLPFNTIEITSDLTLIANFVMIDYTLTLIANPAEGGVVTGAGVYNFGDEVAVDAIANEGWAFVNWTDVDGNEVSDAPANIITMPAADLTLTANFEMVDYTLTLIANPAEGGVVTGAGVYNFGDEVAVDAIANEGWTFVNWTDLDGNEVSDAPANIITMPAADLTLVANFEMVDYTLTLIANPAEGGVVTGAGVYNFGDEVAVDAIPNEGWTFVNWTDLDGNEVSDAPANIITMPAADLTLVANFEMVDYTLTLIANPAEGGVVTGAGVYNFGDEVAVDAIPNEGWAFVNWTDLDGNEVSDAPANIITMPAADLTLIANFELVEFEVTFHVVENSTDEDPIAGAVINISGVADVLITDANGMASIILPIDNYTADITADQYEDILNFSFSVVDQAQDIIILMNDIIVEPFNLAVFTEGYDFGEALFIWNDGLNQFRHDNGVVNGQLGFQGNINSVLGSAYHYDAELKEVVWWLTTEEGAHSTVKLWILALDDFGYPDRDNILYTNSAVPNVDNMWNRYELATPVSAPNGFYIGLSYDGYLSLATDDGLSNDWPFNNKTHFTIFDITTDSHFIPLENDGFEVNFLLRAYGYKFGSVEYHKDHEFVSSSTPPIFIPLNTPFDAGDILTDNYAKSFVGFDVFLNGNQVAEAIPATDYVFKDLEVGFYTAGVRSLYTTGMSDIITIDFEIPARTFRVTFNVVDDEGELLDHAIVTLDGMQNPTGNYTFDGMLAGTYTYVVEKAGYFTVEGQVTVVNESLFVTVELIVDDTSIIAPDDGLNLSLYPNPVRNILTIESNYTMNAVRMVDILGQLVYDVSLNDVRHEIDVNTLKNGIYFVQISTDRGVYTHRIQVAD